MICDSIQCVVSHVLYFILERRQHTKISEVKGTLMASFMRHALLPDSGTPSGGRRATRPSSQPTMLPPTHIKN